MLFSGYGMDKEDMQHIWSLALNISQSPVWGWGGVLKKCRLNWNIVLRETEKKMHNNREKMHFNLSLRLKIHLMGSEDQNHEE